jgi:glyoxylase-like metal-dependent hydrolase (beta-lactamase superfamily II)
MCPRAAAATGIIEKDPGHLVAHCLLIESGDSLILLDTGYGAGDIADPSRLGPARHLLGARLDPAETAIAQVRALGHDPADVRQILTTHLDLDHAGGLGDFPGAEVHVHANELAAAQRRGLDGKLRYRPRHWEHGPRWAAHDTDGEPWFGFERVRVLEDIDVEIAMIALPGHSIGHSGYAINTGDGWLVHCGDAYLQHDEIASPPRTTAGRRFYHRVNSSDARLRQANADRLAELARDHAGEITLFCSHDAGEFAEARNRI